MVSITDFTTINHWKELPLSQWYPYFNHQPTAIFIAITYLITVKSCTEYIKKQAAKDSKTSGAFKAFMLLHNLALAIYSFATFASLFITIYTAVSNSDSLYDTYCDKNQVVWTQSLYFNTWLFYLSKYWEFIDTLILIVKNKVPSLLQCYHHSGAVLGMFYLFNSSSPGAWIFVLLNSLIHAIMYMYYFFTILGYRPKFKKYITGLQLTQFVVGSCLAIPYFIWSECISLKQKLAIAFNLVYVVPLIYLFMKFAKETYTVKNKKN